jgi:hypothetical protein
MKCHFCQNDTVMYHDRINSQNAVVWKCYYCKNRVRHIYDKYDPNAKLLWICISAKIRHKNYSILIDPDSNSCDISEMVISDDRCTVEKINLIARLDFIPNITPDNIEEKLPTYILLS